MKFNLSKAEFALSAGRENQFPRDGRPQIAMSGRSNVGKSSLINTVLGRKKLARTSSEPGKTITVNFYDIDKNSTLSICRVTVMQNVRSPRKESGRR